MRIFGLVCLVSAIAAAGGWSAERKKDGKFEYGLNLRLRQEYVANEFYFRSFHVAPDLGNDDYFRIKAGLWGKYAFNEKMSVYTRMTTEPDIYIHNGNLGKTNYVGDDEVFFDNLYWDVKGAFGLPLDFRIGRQDFWGAYGEGFLIMDGTASDGTRSFYFNAARATWKFNKNNLLDFIYLNDPTHDKFLPVINDLDRKLNSTNEQGLVLYGRNKITEAIALEPYYIYKIEDPIAASPATLTLNTLGARAVWTAASWKLRGEFARQFGGYKNDIGREANGGYLYLDYLFNHAGWTPTLTVGYVYLSGDDPSTAGKNEGWDPLFSRWPWLSEVYYFSYAQEAGEAGYWTNLQALKGGAALTFTPRDNLTVNYLYLLANEDATASPIFGTGKTRGNLAQVCYKHKFNKYLDGTFIGEYFRPGDFYAATNRDPAIFLRLELSAKF